MSVNQHKLFFTLNMAPENWAKRKFDRNQKGKSAERNRKFSQKKKTSFENFCTKDSFFLQIFWVEFFFLKEIRPKNGKFGPNIFGLNFIFMLLEIQPNIKKEIQSKSLHTYKNFDFSRFF